MSGTLYHLISMSEDRKPRQPRKTKETLDPNRDRVYIRWTPEVQRAYDAIIAHIRTVEGTLDRTLFPRQLTLNDADEPVPPSQIVDAALAWLRQNSDKVPWNDMAAEYEQLRGSEIPPRAMKMSKRAIKDLIALEKIVGAKSLDPSPYGGVNRQFLCVAALLYGAKHPTQ